MAFRPISLRLLSISAILAGMTFAQPGLAQSVSGNVKPLNPRVSMKVGAIGALSDAGIFIAYDRGYFKREGLDVQLIRFKAAPQILPSIATNQVWASGSAVTPAFFNAINRGVKMKLVADKGQVTKGFSWASLAIRSDLKNKIKTFKDLKGRKIAITGEGTSATEAGQALALGGLGPKDVTFVKLGLPEMVAALSHKAVDAATLLEPFITLAVVKKIAINWKPMGDFLPYKGQNGIIIFSEQFTKEHPEAAKRWMVAYLHGTRDYMDAITKGKDREAIFKSLAKHTRVKDLSLYNKMAPVHFDPNGRLEKRSLEEDQKWFMRVGEQKKHVDLSTVIDYRYLDYAVARLGKH